jgi:hypothetical protein
MRPVKSRERLQTSSLTMCRQRPDCRHLELGAFALEPELAPEVYIEAMNNRGKKPSLPAGLEIEDDGACNVRSLRCSE